MKPIADLLAESERIQSEKTRHKQRHCFSSQWPRETQALKVAIEVLEYYANHKSVIKEAYHSNEEKQITVVHTRINHKAKEALDKIEKLLNGDGE